MRDDILPGGKGIDRRWMMGGTLLAIASTACGQPFKSSKDQSGAGQLGNGQRADTPSFGARAFGARGDGVADDTPAIQRAIDAAAKAGGGVVTLESGTYLMRYRTSEDGDGASALTMRSGVTLEGTQRDRCILRLADGQMGPGTYARMIASNGELRNVTLRRFSIDGNRQGQGRFRDDLSGAAVLLGWKARCVAVTVEDLAVRDAIGQGIMLQGSVGDLSRDLRITNNLVERSSYIGIQSSQFDGLMIVDNRVNDCHDNGIDIYGDDTTHQSPVATSHNATITGNEVQRCSVGIFLETVADSIAGDNVITDCRSVGVRVNRIHGQPRNLTIERNRISGTPTGVAMGGETGGVVIRANVIRGFSIAAISFEYNVSNVTATGNTFLPATRITPIVFARPTVANAMPPQQLSHIHILANHIPAGHDVTKLFDHRYRSLVDVEVGRFVVK